MHHIQFVGDIGGLRAFAGARRAQENKVQLILLLDKALVAAHHQLSFQLFHRVQHDADHNE